MNKRKKLINEIANRIVGRLLTENKTTVTNLHRKLSSEHNNHTNITDLVNYTGYVLKNPYNFEPQAYQPAAANISFSTLNVVPAPGEISSSGNYIDYYGVDNDTGLNRIPSSERVKLANTILDMVQSFFKVLQARIEEIKGDSTGGDVNTNLQMLDTAKGVQDTILRNIVTLLNEYEI